MENVISEARPAAQTQAVKALVNEAGNHVHMALDILRELDKMFKATNPQYAKLPDEPVS